jgi:ABC-type uncharacterized transport system ATPase subunit
MFVSTRVRYSSPGWTKSLRYCRAVQPAAPAIEVAGLNKRYGAIRAVDDLSLTVEPGEVFGVLGPNGADKTTTVEVLGDRGDVAVPLGGVAR